MTAPTNAAAINIENTLLRMGPPAPLYPERLPASAGSCNGGYADPRAGVYLDRAASLSLLQSSFHGVKSSVSRSMCRPQAAAGRRPTAGQALCLLPPSRAFASSLPTG